MVIVDVVKKKLIIRACVAGVAGALLVLPQTATAAGGQLATEVAARGQACQMTRLPVPPGVTGSQVTGGGHAGRYLAGEGLVLEGTEWRNIALQWVDGQVRVVDTSALRPYANVFVTDVNSRGVVVGFRLTSGFQTDAWVYQAGRARILRPLYPGDDAEAAAINSRGDIVGTSGPRAVLWPADQPGTVRELTIPGVWPPIRGIDIDDDGTVLGFVGYRPTEEQYPYVWPARGEGYPLRAPEGTGYPDAVAVHSGQVVGTVYRGAGTTLVTRWDLRTRTAELVTTEGVWGPVAVDRQGTIATDGALIYRNGTVRELGGTIRVLSDRHTAAGADEPLLLGNAVMWEGCRPIR